MIRYIKNLFKRKEYLCHKCGGKPKFKDMLDLLVYKFMPNGYLYYPTRVLKIINVGCFYLIHIDASLSKWEKAYKNNIMESPGFDHTFVRIGMITYKDIEKYKVLRIHWKNNNIMVLQKNAKH